MDSVSVIVTVVTVVASLGAIILVAFLIRQVVLSRRRTRTTIAPRVDRAASWQERAAMYEATGQYADYKCPYVPHSETPDDSEVASEKP